MRRIRLILECNYDVFDKYLNNNITKINNNNNSNYYDHAKNTI